MVESIVVVLLEQDGACYDDVKLDVKNWGLSTVVLERIPR